MSKADVDVEISSEPNYEHYNDGSMSMIMSDAITYIAPDNYPLFAGSKREREPLQFDFRGYSIWCEIDGCEVGGDYHCCIQDCAKLFGVQPIHGHVTAMYGMAHLSEDEIVHRFLNIVKPEFTERGGWPALLKPVGLLSDVELEGVNDGEMNMAWSELTLATSNDHEECLDFLHHVYFGSSKVRKTPWKPHASLVYDNHIGSQLNLLDTIRVASQYPNFMKDPKKVTALSLWNTNGKFRDWKQLERFEFV